MSIITMITALQIQAGVRRADMISAQDGNGEGYHGIVYIIGSDIRATSVKMVEHLGIHDFSEKGSYVENQALLLESDYDDEQMATAALPTFALENKKLMGYLSDTPSQKAFNEVALDSGHEIEKNEKLSLNAKKYHF